MLSLFTGALDKLQPVIYNHLKSIVILRQAKQIFGNLHNVRVDLHRSELELDHRYKILHLQLEENRPFINILNSLAVSLTLDMKFIRNEARSPPPSPISKASTFSELSPEILKKCLSIPKPIIIILWC